MEKSTYQLVGIMNPLGEVPDMVFPVFGKDRRLFLPVCELTTIIDGFSEIKDVDHMAMITPLSQIKPIYGKVQEEGYSIGSDELIAYQMSPDTVFFGDITSFNTFIEQNPITSELVQDQVDTLNHDNRLAGQYRKKFQPKQAQKKEQ